LLARASVTCKLDRTVPLRDKDALTTLRNTSFAEIQFPNAQGLSIATQAARSNLQKVIAEEAAAESIMKFQDVLKQAKGIAKLAGLRELADKADGLLQIELSNAAGASSGGTTTTGAAGTSAPGTLAACGQAIITLATKGAAVVDTYRGETPSARAQSLIIARVALTQQIEVAALEAALTETELRLLIAKRDCMITAVH
jgi:hypothetical protein